MALHHELTIALQSVMNLSETSSDAQCLTVVFG